MRSEILSQENNAVTIKAEFDAQEFEAGIQKAISELSSKISVPGFRKGKVPRKIMEMRFGKQALHAEALEQMLPDAIEEIVREYELDLISEPEVKVEKMEEGSTVDIRLAFEVTPEISLPDLGSISVEKRTVPVTDDMVASAVEELRLQNSTLSPVDRPAARGDVVNLEYFTVISGQNGEEERHGPEKTLLDTAQPTVRSEIRDAVLGKGKGEETVAEVTVDEDYHDGKLAGKKLRYEISVESVSERILPGMNGEFFGKVLQAECSTEEKFREEIAGRLRQRMELESTSRAEYDAVEKISSLAGLTVPETLIGRQVRAMKQEDEEKLRHSHNTSIEDFLKEASTTMEEYEKKLREQAEAIVRRSLVLDRIADEKGIKVEKEDFEKEMESLASAYRIDAGRLVNSLFKDEKRMMEMANRIKYRKTVQAIMSSVKVAETEAPAGEKASE